MCGIDHPPPQTTLDLTAHCHSTSVLGVASTGVHVPQLKGATTSNAPAPRCTLGSNVKCTWTPVPGLCASMEALVSRMLAVCPSGLANVLAALGVPTVRSTLSAKSTRANMAVPVSPRLMETMCATVPVVTGVSTVPLLWTYAKPSPVGTMGCVI